MEEKTDSFNNLTFLPSRIPAVDALSMFVAKGHEKNPDVLSFSNSKGSSRWLPIKGGHKVLIPYEGGKYDTNKIQLEKDAWDHEHCKGCNNDIESMKLCWVTKTGPYIVLCEDCYKKMSEIPK